MAFVAPVSPVVSSCGSSICCTVVCGSSRSICCLVLWLQYLSFVAPVAVSVVVHGSSLLYLLFVTPVSSICPRSWLPQWLVQAVARGSSGSRRLSLVRASSTTICCHLWLQWLSLVAPVFVTCGSSGCRLWLQYLSLVAPVSVVRSSSICRLLVATVSVCRSWLRYLVLWLSFVAPVAVVLSCGSSICCGCLQYHYLLLVAPVDPVSVACGSCCSCGFNRQSSSVLAIFFAK